MADITPRAREAQKSAQILERHLKVSAKNITVADAVAQSGLSMLEAERGMQHLVSEYRGHLSATESGELLFAFPTGFSKPWEKIDRISKLWRKTKNVLLGVAKFVVRTWITVVMVAYVAIFALILIGLSFAKSNDRDQGHSFGGTMLLHTLFRVVMDSLFWTFHPFSPFNARNYDPHGQQNRQKNGQFYEKVNRFFFGPEKTPVDELEVKRRILEEIRALNGRIGLSDILRVTGFEKDKVDPLMSRLMLDYDGDVVVSNKGGITYRFIGLRKTGLDTTARRVTPIWEKTEKLLPLTGNTGGSNLLIAGLNGFNLLMSSVAITSGWTVAKLHYMFTVTPQAIKLGIAPPMPEGTPFILGWVPFYFSLALFALPVIRVLVRPREKRRVAHENGRRGLLRGILTRLNPKGIDEATLKNDWTQAATIPPRDREFTREVIKLGGEMDIGENARTYFKFPDLEAERDAVIDERQQARSDEQDAGRVVFSSAKD